MAWADLHLQSADDDASTASYFRNLGMEPPSEVSSRVSLADRFGEVEAELRRLKVRRDELKQEIINTGRVELVGHTWTVVIEDKTGRRAAGGASRGGGRGCMPEGTIRRLPAHRAALASVGETNCTTHEIRRDGRRKGEQHKKKFAA